MGKLPGMTTDCLSFFAACGMEWRSWGICIVKPLFPPFNPSSSSSPPGTFGTFLPHVGQVCGLFSGLFVISQVLCCVYGMGILAGAVFALDSFFFLFYFISNGNNFPKKEYSMMLNETLGWRISPKTQGPQKEKHILLWVCSFSYGSIGWG